MADKFSGKKPSSVASSDSTTQVRTAYDEWSEVYDRDTNHTRDLNGLILRQQDFNLPGKTVLEIGCETGINTEWLSQYAHHVEAVDISNKMLAIAKRRVTSNNVNFHNGNITQPWHFKDVSFDLLVINLVLEHIANLEPIFRESHRVLKAQGLLYISELHPYRQLRGSQAKYKNAQTGRETLVPAFKHSVSEFINMGIKAKFILQKLDEPKRSEDDTPRLLTMLFERI